MITNHSKAVKDLEELKVLVVRTLMFLGYGVSKSEFPELNKEVEGGWAKPLPKLMKKLTKEGRGHELKALIKAYSTDIENELYDLLDNIEDLILDYSKLDDKGVCLNAMEHPVPNMSEISLKYVEHSLKGQKGTK